jgi:hypothetical protein
LGVALAPPGRPLLSSDHHYFIKVPKKPEGAAKFMTHGNELQKKKEGHKYWEGETKLRNLQLE